jgi:hypothetical protein
MLDRQFSHHQEGDGGFELFRQHNDRAACLSEWIGKGIPLFLMGRKRSEREGRWIGVAGGVRAGSPSMTSESFSG